MRKIIPVVAAGAALAVTAAGVGYAALDKDVTVSLDGQERTVSTTAGTVGELLAEEGITVSDRDVVAPATTAGVDEGTRVAVQFARPVTFDVDGKPRTIWTTATSLDQALRALDVNTAGAALSTSRSATIGRQGLDVDVDTLKTVTVKVDGKNRQVKTTGTRVADALAAAKVRVDRDDRLSSKPNAALTAGASITYTRVDVRKVTEQRKVSFDTVRKNTSSLTRGATEVDTAGRSGTRTITYREVREDGDVVSRKRTSSKITKQPRDRVVLVGTKAPKVSKPDRSGSGSSGSDRSGSGSSGSGSSGSGSSAPSVASGGVWDRLAQCESGGNWSINTGNGFYGGLQFTPSTWRGYGGTGMPHQASRAEQIAVAKRVQAGQGWGAWPACTAKLGIR